MEKLVLISLLSLLAFSGNAQFNHQFCEHPIDTPFYMPLGGGGDGKFSGYGSSHTMQGHLHILLIFCGLEKDSVLNLGSNWEYWQLPTWANDLFETDTNNIGNNNNLSTSYKSLSQFSENPFLVTADVFPEKVSTVVGVINNHH